MTRKKISFSILAALFSLVESTAFAVQWRFYGPGRQELMSGGTDIDLNTDLHAFTTGLLRSSHRLFSVKRVHDMPYIDSMFGLSSQMLTLSPGVLRSFGWCFTINGIAGQNAASATRFRSN